MIVYNKFLKLNLIILLAGLTACNHYSVETRYDEFRKTQACSLKNNLLKTEWAPFMGTRRLELTLDRFDSELILAHFYLYGANRSSFFKYISNIIFKLTSKDKNIEEIRLTSTNPAQNKSSSFSYVGAMGVTTSVNETMSVVSTEITREQISKIANAEKVEFLIETIDQPLRGELDQEDLYPFQEFVSKCLIKNKN